MSRGLGKREREILAQLTDKPMRIGGATRSERTANGRAARSLERRGLADVLVLWNANRTGGIQYVVRAGATTRTGQTWKSLSAACAPPGALATLEKRPRLQGSLRTIAQQERVSVATVRRVLKKIQAKAG